MMQYDEAVAYLYSFQKFGWLFGRLERMQRFLARLGNPHHALRFIHIAGTNGKGTTTALCSNILQAAGYRVGMFVSPYVMDFTERFQINTQQIAREQLVTLVDRVKSALEELYKDEPDIPITVFELLTILGFVYFAEQKCDVVCLETGLGGGDDATNVIWTPLVSVITSISMDHMDILGNTIGEIASHKAGIIKPYSPCVCYPKQHPDALAVIATQCEQTQSSLVVPDRNELQIVRCDVAGSAFWYRGVSYELKLAGEHQIYNAITALEVIDTLSTQGFSVSSEHKKKGVGSTYFPARFERLGEKPLVIADIAHNEESMQGLMKTLEQIPIKKVFLIGVLADKEVDKTLALLAPQAKEIICITPDNPRALKASELAKRAEAYCKATFLDDHFEAYQAALASAGPDGCVVLCGSFYVMERLLAHIKSNENAD